MQVFLSFLAVIIFAHTCAAQANNSGDSSAENGSSSIAVIDNATFGNGAFSNTQPQTTTQRCGLIQNFLSLFIPNVDC
ncbi:hypothetical protein B5X24_HaOG209420 [Helicoverpa armigera]|uniref:Uncharacterized protein n=1 Tax=Helicoverpa armigera TaxID=29058 RepID=A0A2W1BEH8_HELAM|nr:hypothetical protein B5X24_HaOG209420 [Helicoverpa armigera]